MTNQQQPGPAIGRAVGNGVGAVVGDVAGAGVGVVEGTAGGIDSAFDNTQRSSVIGVKKKQPMEESFSCRWIFSWMQTVKSFVRFAKFQRSNEYKNNPMSSRATSHQSQLMPRGFAAPEPNSSFTNSP